MSVWLKFATITVSLAGVAEAYAITSEWKGSSQNWSINGQWSPSGEPTQTDSVLINSGAGTITLNAGEVASDLTVTTTGWTLSKGTLHLDSTGTINVDNGLLSSMAFTIDSSLVGTGVNITKTGADTLILTGSNTYTGTTTVSEGVVNIQNSSALGSTDGGTTVSSGGELQLQGGITIGAETFNLYGTGFNGAGALRNLFGSNSIGGLVALSGNTVISSDAGTLTFDPVSGPSFQGAFGLTFAGAGNIVVNAPMTDLTSLWVSGPGTVTLNGANTFSGATTVSGGTLALNGSLSGALNVTGGTITGTGNFGDFTLNSGAAITPGSSGAGKFSFANTTFLGGTYNVDILGTAAGTQYDQIDVTGSFDFTANVALNINLGSFDPPDDGSLSFTIINNDGTDPLNGFGLFTYAGSSIANGQTFIVGTQGFRLNYFGGNGNDVVLVAVPEPGTVAMILGGFATLLSLQRQRRFRK